MAEYSWKVSALILSFTESCQSDWFGTIADNKQLPHPTGMTSIGRGHWSKWI